MIDFINCLFVAAGVAFAYLDLKQIQKDRSITGMHLCTAMLFTAWPLWDLFYYHHLEQYVSMAVCLVLAAIRIEWFCLVWRYRP